MSINTKSTKLILLELIKKLDEISSTDKSNYVKGRQKLVKKFIYPPFNNAKQRHMNNIRIHGQLEGFNNAVIRLKSLLKQKIKQIEKSEG